MSFAVGAKSATVLLKVLRDGMTILGADLALGIATSLLLARLLQSLLYETSSQNPTALITVALILGLMGLVAC